MIFCIEFWVTCFDCVWSVETFRGNKRPMFSGVPIILASTVYWRSLNISHNKMGTQSFWAASYSEAGRGFSWGLGDIVYRVAEEICSLVGWTIFNTGVFFLLLCLDFRSMWCGSACLRVSERGTNLFLRTFQSINCSYKWIKRRPCHSVLNTK